jgi:hypothetical protein
MVTVQRRAVVRDWPAGTADAISGGPWLVVHCRPRQERKVEQDCAMLGIPGCAFFERRLRRYPGKGMQEGFVPLLGGYVFVRAEREDHHLLWGTGRIVRVITPPDPDQLVQELNSLVRMVHAAQGPLVVRPDLVIGQTIDVRAGVFAGCRGVIRRRANASDLVVNIELLGHSVRVQLPADTIT